MSGERLTDDPAALGEMIEAGEAQGTGVPGQSLTGGGDLMGRLMNSSPDPALEDVEPYKLDGWDSGLRYLRRGIGKFTGAGATAAEDLAMGVVNLFVGIYRGFTSAPEDATEREGWEQT